MIPYGKQNIDQSDIDAVTEVLKSDWLTQGPKVPLFESKVAAFCDANFSVATNSATSALHIACLALNVGENDLVWTSPISFVASSNCALYCGAQVDFLDIELETGNISVKLLKDKLLKAKSENALPKVIIPVHLAGQSCDMEEIHKLSKDFGFKIIEDASHAIGGSYKNSKVGSCSFSDITVFSFHPVKIITSAEGGMALTNDEKLARRMQMLRSHGITSDEAEMTEPSHGVWYYQQQYLGFNYRMTDIQAALGLNQLTKIDNFIKRRNQLAHFYDKTLRGSKAVPLTQKPNTYNAYHLYIVRVPSISKLQHKELISKLRNAGLIGHLHYIPIYLQPFYKQMGFQEGYCKNAEEYYSTAITLPLFPDLKESEIEYICTTLNKLLD
jgi:UDP-4-amino-4,6-dideoxy-N-acetyl-beta-L-altrosamine transaminase